MSNSTIEAFLARHRLSASMFGRLAAQDPRLVADLRKGRELREPLDQRVRGFMDGFEFARTLRSGESRDGR
jgi:2,4-dienoyl-CoA reductase-like NADH-dependent reductase (Old Yellow Enzyme family)